MYITILNLNIYICECVCVFIYLYLFVYIKYVHLEITLICKQINPNMRRKAPKSRVIGHSGRAGGQEAYEHCLKYGHEFEPRKAIHELHTKQCEDPQRCGLLCFSNSGEVMLRLLNIVFISEPI